MLHLWGEQVPHGWVTGDDEPSRHTQFRHDLRERGERYVLGVPCITTIRDLEAPLPEYQRAAGLAGCHRSGRSLSLSLLLQSDRGGRRGAGGALTRRIGACHQSERLY
jgi:hypothetical protein